MTQQMIIRALLIVFLFGGSITTGYNQENIDFSYGDGIKFTAPDSSMATKMRFRFQNRFVTSRALNKNASFNSSAKIRRARLKFSGFAISPNLTYKVEIGLSNNDLHPTRRENGNVGTVMLDAVAKWEALPNFEIWFGQTKLPGNRQRVISSQDMQLVDRSAVNGTFNLDRDMGFQFRHSFHAGSWLIREKAAITQGEGRDVISGNEGGYNYIGRLEVLPFGAFTNGGDYFGSDLAREETPKLSIGGGYNYNDRAARSKGQRGNYLPEHRTLKTTFADLMFKYQGFSLMSEYMRNDARDSYFSSDSAFVTGEGFMVQSGYLFKNNLEVAGRFTSISPEEDAPAFTGTNDYTIGLSKYISGHYLKVQTDVTLRDMEGMQDPVMRYRLQMEVGI